MRIFLVGHANALMLVLDTYHDPGRDWSKNSHGRLLPLGLLPIIRSGTFWLVLHCRQCENWQNLKICNFALDAVNYIKISENRRKIIQCL